MTHQEVTSKWKGKNYAETSSLGFQCVGWAKKYCEEMGYPLKSFGGSAIQGWKTGNPFDSNWKRIEKTKYNYPPMGAVVFWDQGKHGHVSIANGWCTPLLLRHIDQNGGGKYEVIQSRWSTYDRVVGWYVRK